MVLKEDKEKIKALLTEAITVLCKNGLSYDFTCCIQGLLGITLDESEVFIVDFKETIKKAEKPEPENEFQNEPIAQGDPECPKSPEKFSRSGAARRRRRRSNSDSGSPPIKQKNLGEDKGNDEVIFVKEEFDDNSNLDTVYADSHGQTGNQTQSETYQSETFQSEQQNYDMSTNEAGYSEWDNSSLPQSSWPQSTLDYPGLQGATPELQITAPRSLMVPSSSHMIATSISKRPCGNLKDQDIVNILCEHLVLPFNKPDYKVTAVRMSWHMKNLSYLNNVMEKIVDLRLHLDKNVCRTSGLELCVSAISATRAGKTDGKKLHEDIRNKIYPAISYWLVFKEENFSNADMFRFLQHIGGSAGAIPKLLLQPYQQEDKDLSNALNAVLKDGMEGGVREMVDFSANQCLGKAPGDYNIVKAIVINQELKERVVNLRDSLAKFKFFIDVE